MKLPLHRTFKINEAYTLTTMFPFATPTHDDDNYCIWQMDYYMEEISVCSVNVVGLSLHLTGIHEQGAIQVLRNADGGGGGLIFWKKALRRCNVQCY